MLLDLCASTFFFSLWAWALTYFFESLRAGVSLPYGATLFGGEIAECRKQFVGSLLKVVVARCVQSLVRFCGVLLQMVCRVEMSSQRLGVTLWPSFLLLLKQAFGGFFGAGQLPSPGAALGGPQ